MWLRILVCGASVYSVCGAAETIGEVRETETRIAQVREQKLKVEEERPLPKRFDRCTFSSHRAGEYTVLTVNIFNSQTGAKYEPVVNSVLLDKLKTQPGTRLLGGDVREAFTLDGDQLKRVTATPGRGGSSEVTYRSNDGFKNITEFTITNKFWGEEKFHIKCVPEEPTVARRL